MKLRKRTYTGQLTTEVTAREMENRQVARRAAADGFVLLKNDGGTLPLRKGSRVAMYGGGSVKTVKGGTGSGDVNERDCVSLYQGMVNAGFEITSKDWLEEYEETYLQAKIAWRDEIFAKAKNSSQIHGFFGAYSSTPFRTPAGNAIDEKKAAEDGADTAIFVISRIAGESADRHDTKGDYYISDEEKALLAEVSRCYEHVVLVVNTGGLMDLAFCEDFTNIDAILQLMQPGQEGGNAFADVISGKVTPSGKMTDTWALDYQDYPNAKTFSYQSGDITREDYIEGIYVGYRYFDSFERPVRYCFGHGLSYTDFAIETLGIRAAEEKLSVQVKVSNIGSVYSGKEVVQIYVSCPQGRMTKEFRRLAAFGKTGLLAPGASEELTITFPLYQLASYDEEKSAYILEAGSYGIWVGNSLENAVISASFELDQEAMLVQCRTICPLQQELEEICPDQARLLEREAEWKQAAAELPKAKGKASELSCRVIPYSTLEDPLTGEAAEIVEKLSLEQLIALATGEPAMGQGSTIGNAGQTVPGAAAETTTCAEAAPWEVPSIVLTDGPAGLRLNQSYEVKNGSVKKGNFLQAIEHGFFSAPAEPDPEAIRYYQYCTAIPVGTLLAQTWDPQLIQEVGEMIGGEMNLFETTLWLAPGMNIHRNPLCGRNFEYYSEDPLVSGIMAAAMTFGVQKVPGCGTTIKHFACNNQEDNRNGSDSVLSERALREIYLKGFEIAVKNSQPMSIMTSYNIINGVHAANCYDICTAAARDEWGFAGVIMTDWGTTREHEGVPCTAAGCVRAQNDLTMPGMPFDRENIRQELEAGTLDLRELKRCAANTVRICRASNQFEDQVSYLDQFEGLNGYLTVTITGR